MEESELLQQFIGTMMKVRRFIDPAIGIPQEDKTATLLQTQALTFLKEHPQSTVGELAQYLHMSSSAIAQFTDRLTDAHLIERKNDPNDRRIVRLSLTATGDDRLISLRKVIQERMGNILTRIPEKDLKEVIRIFGNLLENLEEENK
ncbi:MAG: MarR family winged helix-turn-helix transcriptional regulator [Candidatus Levyibacteriota bacterium]